MLRAFLLVLRSYLEFKDRPGYVLKGPPGKRRWHKWWGGGYEGDQEAHLREGLHGESIGRVADLMSSLTFKDFGTPRLVHISRVPLFAVDTPIGQAIVKPLNDPALQNKASGYGLSLQEFQDMVAAGATLAYRAADALGVPIVPVGIISPAASEGHSEWVEGVLDALRGGGTASEFLEAIPPDHRAEFERRVKEYSSYWTQPFAEGVLRQTSWVVSPFVESVGLRPKSVVKGGKAGEATLMRLLARQAIGEELIGVPDRNPTNYVPIIYEEMGRDGSLRSVVLPVSVDYVWSPDRHIVGQARRLVGLSPLYRGHEDVERTLFRFGEGFMGRSKRMREEWHQVVQGRLPNNPHPATRGALDVLARLPDLPHKMGPFGSLVEEWLEDYQSWVKDEPLGQVIAEWRERGS